MVGRLGYVVKLHVLDRERNQTIEYLRHVIAVTDGVRYDRDVVDVGVFLAQVGTAYDVTYSKVIGPLPLVQVFELLRNVVEILVFT